jgi:hypothetical protein
MTVAVLALLAVTLLAFVWRRGARPDLERVLPDQLDVPEEQAPLSDDDRALLHGMVAFIAVPVASVVCVFGVLVFAIAAVASRSDSAGNTAYYAIFAGVPLSGLASAKLAGLLLRERRGSSLRVWSALVTAGASAGLLAWFIIGLASDSS